MPLGSRFAERGRAAVIASLASTPREPLSFLYPQWMRCSSTASTIGTKQAERSSQRRADALPQSTREGPFLHEQPTRSSVLSDLENDACLQKGAVIPGIKSYLRKDDDHNDPAQFSKDNSESRPESQHSAIANPTSKVRRIIQRNLKARISAEHNREVRSEYQSRKRAEKNQIWVPDWRVVLADLFSNTPKNEKWLEIALNISVPKHAVNKLLCGVDDNLWDIAGKHGCSVYLNGQDSGTEEHRDFLLSGGATAISKTAADILQIAPRVKMKARTSGLSLADIKNGATAVGNLDTDGVQRSRDGKARKTMSGSRPRIPVTRAENIPKPTEWTQQTFADYVNRLTSSEVPNHLHRFMYKTAGDHTSAVIGILRKIFEDPACRTSLSRSAFNMAIAYFVKTNQMLDARMFFVQMEMLNIPMNDKTFNALLRGAAKNEDLQNFHFILHLMLRRRILPNAGTWIAFLMAVPDLRIKLHAWNKMKECGLLQHIGTVRDACEHIVIHEISNSLDNAQSQAEFLDYMDSRYGPSWLTINSGNRIIHALGARGLISRCWDFLQVMDNRFVKPNEMSINLILNHCKQSGNISGALELLKNIPSSFGFVPDEMTYHTLFEMAWRGKSYNLAKVVWRYACLNAATTRSMRNRIITSLRSPKWKMHEPGQSPRQYFGRSAGLFICAFEHSPDHPKEVFRRAFRDTVGFDMLDKAPNIPDPVFASAKVRDSTSQSGLTTLSDVENTQDPHVSEPVCVELGPSPAMSSSTRRVLTSLPLKLRQRYLQFLDQDCELFQTWDPVRPFADMLVEARALDIEWTNPQDYEKREEMGKFKWKLQNAITIPIVAKINFKRIEMVWK